MKTYKPLVRELLWLVAAIAIALLIIIFGLPAGLNDTVDIHIHDTYFVISSNYITWPLLLFVIFIIFLFKELRHKFGRSVPNRIILISGLTLVALNGFLLRSIPVISSMVSYPPSIGPAREQYHYYRRSRRDNCS